MEKAERYADMIGIPVQTVSVTVKAPAKRGRKKKETVLEKALSAELSAPETAETENALKDGVLSKVNEGEISGENPAVECPDTLEVSSADNAGELLATDEKKEAKSFVKRLLTRRKKKTDDLSSEKNRVADESSAGATVRVKTRRKAGGVLAGLGVGALCICAVLGTVALSDTLDLSSYLAGVFSVQTQKVKAYGEYEAGIPCLSPSNVSLSEGVMTVSGKGSVYLPCDGTVETVEEDGGKYTLTVRHGEDFSTKIAGLDYCYAEEGDRVYKNVPVGYGLGDGYRVFLYSASGQITDYAVDGNVLVWNGQGA